MPRRREVPKRHPLPDPKYHSVVLAKFINTVMLRGKKSIAESIVYGALDIIKTVKPEEDPLTVFETALDNAKPLLQVKSRRVGGATYQVPGGDCAGDADGVGVSLDHRVLAEARGEDDGAASGGRIAGLFRSAGRDDQA